MLDRVYFGLAGRIVAAGTLAVALIVGGLAAPAPARADVSRAELALRWAPINYQDVDVTGAHALAGKSDYITRVDFDGDLAGRNDWDHAGQSTAAAAYYDVVETSTHWFITYLYFHPRDWTDTPLFETEHENDGEGLTLAVEKDGSTYGKLRGMVTVAHTNFYSYTPSGSTWTKGAETVDGTVQLQSSPHDSFQHPAIGQEAKGHGLKAYPQVTINGDGIVYYPSTVSESPSSANDRDVQYQLVDIFAADGLWAQRTDPALFASLGTFAGDKSGDCGHGTWACTLNSANAPWGWDDADDAPARGELATDPAKLCAQYFTVPGTFSRTYTYNPYAGAAAALKAAARTAPPNVD